ncbi:uncharacterized protein BXZ73DRAFT_101086 [Epithele typhae]|uniref:uncharacterized protein n=1 Tax=Epithele typhae TaxID=378194 RepID=UPI002007AAEC|nr:uncharacterized protein BXZ73DRAFT_101086 [Epithele typhae]KAH9933116.1 hypothetical protein BXZ73DRAFT_101086 [Epithele typhae]
MSDHQNTLRSSEHLSLGLSPPIRSQRQHKHVNIHNPHAYFPPPFDRTTSVLYPACNPGSTSSSSTLSSGRATTIPSFRSKPQHPGSSLTSVDCLGLEIDPSETKHDVLAATFRDRQQSPSMIPAQPRSLVSDPGSAGSTSTSSSGISATLFAPTRASILAWTKATPSGPPQTTPSSESRSDRHGLTGSAGHASTSRSRCSTNVLALEDIDRDPHDDQPFTVPLALHPDTSSASCAPQDPSSSPALVVSHAPQQDRQDRLDRREQRHHNSHRRQERERDRERPPFRMRDGSDGSSHAREHGATDDVLDEILRMVQSVDLGRE